jgi:glycosyltransferase involved in cell wall biosynthesis
LNYKVVVPSADARNLVQCVRAILEKEPDLPVENIIVVDDGAREAAAGQLPGVTWLDGVKPFVYARNSNLGILAANSDVILFNDDAQLMTPCGFQMLSACQQEHPGLLSASVDGVVCNPNQLHTGSLEYRVEPEMLAFICVYIPAWVQHKVGLLDERFEQYGYEDDDYCLRCKNEGVPMGVLDSVLVDHTGLELTSTFRSKPNHKLLKNVNERKFKQKWPHALKGKK